MDNMYKEIVENSDIGYAYNKIICDDNNKAYDYECIEVNKAFAKCIGLKEEEMLGEKSNNFLQKILDKESDWLDYFAKIAINGEKDEYEKYSKATDKWYKIQVFSPKKYYFVINCIDVSEQKKVEEILKSNELRYMQLAEESQSVIWEVDKDGLYTYVSPVVEKLFGYSPKEMIGKMYVYDIPRVVGNVGYKEEILTSIRNKQSISNFKNRFKTKDNEDVWVSTNGVPVLDGKGELLFYRGIDIEITYLKRTEEEMIYLSFKDQLTDLYNRRFFEEELLRLDTKRNLPLSLIMIDIDGLKLVNDAFGHRTGDLLLKKIANIIKEGSRADDIASRIGGDEFVILLPKTSLEEAEAIINRINREVKKERIEGINLSISYGCATKEEAHEKIEDVLKKADFKMYNSKTLTQGKFRRQIIEMILERLFEKSPVEKLHSETVSELSGAIGKALKLSDLEIKKLKTIGKFHDIGKIVVKKEVLNKKERLTKGEWEEIKRHPEAGYIILSSSSEHGAFAEDVLHHHERYDGKGYPKGLKGEKIPFNSRIIAIAATYDAMTRPENYREKVSSDEAVRTIIEESGKQFDPKIVDAFLKII